MNDDYAKQIAAEAYQVIGALAFDHKDVEEALDYFFAVANGEKPESILPFPKGAPK